MSSADRATWASFQNRQNLELLVAGDPALFNPYGSILVNPAKGPHIKAAEARVWHEWLTSDAAGRRSPASGSGRAALLPERGRAARVSRRWRSSAAPSLSP